MVLKRVIFKFCAHGRAAGTNKVNGNCGTFGQRG